jgi:hypothetical protein
LSRPAWRLPAAAWLSLLAACAPQLHDDKVQGEAASVATDSGGQTDPGPGGAEGGAIDGGAGEGAASDGGATDTGDADGGAADGGGTTDGGTTDGGTTDGGATDGGTTDGGTTDGGATDGGTTDGGTTDGGTTDGGTTDGGTTDGGATGGDTGAPIDPCHVVLPADTLVVRTASAVSDDGLTLWVCRNATASVTGAGVRALGEAGADLVIGGAGAQLWLRDRATANLIGAGATVAHEARATITDRAGDASLTTCTVITVDSSALSSGC